MLYWVLRILLFVGLAAAFAAWRSSGGAGDPGTGSTVADEVYNAIHPKVGEPLETPDADTTDAPLKGRLASAAAAQETWAIDKVLPVQSRGELTLEGWKFKDGSTLTFAENDPYGDGVRRLHSVTIART